MEGETRIIPHQLVYCYHEKDLHYLEDLERFFTQLKNHYHIDSWYSRMAMPGTEKEKEDRLHLLQADIVLILVSPDFLAEEYHYDQQMLIVRQRSQEGNVLVASLLLRPTAGEMTILHKFPVFLAQKPSIAEWRSKERAFQQLAQELEQAIHKRFPGWEPRRHRQDMSEDLVSLLGRDHDYYAYRDRPTHYVPRHALLDQLKDRLRASLLKVNTSPRAVVLHGMPGIGKTALARVLCDDPAIHILFPDGILWAHLGQEPDLITLLREWINTKALGGSNNVRTPIQNALKNELSSRLRQKACLLILDDVWQIEHARAFWVDASKCCYLLTTRDAEIAHDLEADLFPLPAMTQEEAAQLLERWAEHNLQSSSPQLKADIVRRLTHLPLAIKLAGAQLRDEVPDMWLDQFNLLHLQARRLSSEYPYRSVTDALELSLKALERTQPGKRRLYTALSIFKAGEPIPQVTIERLWQQLGDMTPTETKALLKDLAAQAFVEDYNPRHIFPTIRIHDLLREISTVEIGRDAFSVHQALLESYRSSQVGEGWHTLSDDGYLYSHLVYHLSGLQSIDEIRALFANHHWLHARVRQQDYLYDGYLEDLDVAWHLAETQAQQQIEAGEDPRGLADSVHYLLLRSSIQSLAENYQPELVKQAVHSGLWTFQRALALACRIPDPYKKADLCLQLVQITHVSQEEQQRIQQIGLETALTLSDPWLRARRLARLAPHLCIELRHRALEEAVRATLSFGSGWPRANMLITLAPQVEEEQRYHLLEQALHDTFTLESEEDGGQTKADLLGELAPLLSKDLLEQAFQEALSSYETRDGINMLLRLVPYMQGETLAQAQQKVVELVTDPLVLEVRRELLIMDFAPWFNEVYMEQVLQVTRALSDPWKRARALEALAPHVGEKYAQHVQQAMRTLRKTSLRTSVLMKLIPSLGEKERQQALEHVLQAAESPGKTDRERAEMLQELAPHLQGAFLDRVLQMALGFQDALVGAETIETLITHVPLEQRQWLTEHILQALLTHPNASEHVNFSKARLLARFAHRVQGTLHLQALEEAVRLSPLSTSGRLDTARMGDARLLEELVPQLQGTLLEEILQKSQIIEDAREQANALRMLAPSIRQERRQQVIECALQTALRITDRKWRGEILEKLLPFLEGEQRQLALEEGLHLALALIDYSEGIHDELLLKFTQHLHGKHHQQIIKLSLQSFLALNWEWDYFKIKMLKQVAPQLNGSLLRYTIQALLTEGWDANLRLPFPRSARVYNRMQLEQTLHQALTLKADWKRAAVFVLLTPYLHEHQLERVSHETIALKDRLMRTLVLAFLVRYMHGEQRQMYLEQVLPTVLLLDAPHELMIGARNELLGELAPYLHGELLARAMREALQLSGEGKWIIAPLKLALQVQGELLTQMMQTILTFPNHDGCIQVLGTLVPNATDQSALLQVIRMRILKFLHSLKQEARSDALLFIARDYIFMPPVFSPETLELIASSIMSISNEWQWF